MVAQLKEATVATARRSVVPGLAIEGPGGRQDKLQIMLQLRIRQHAVAEGRHRVEIDLVGDGAPRAAVSTFDFRLSAQDEEDLRWYLEDFLQHPEEPAPAIARRIEGLMAEVGTKLFAGVFQANDDPRDVWGRVRERLGETRI